MDVKDLEIGDRVVRIVADITTPKDSDLHSNLSLQIQDCQVVFKEHHRAVVKHSPNVQISIYGRTGVVDASEVDKSYTHCTTLVMFLVNPDEVDVLRGVQQVMTRASVLSTLLPTEFPGFKVGRPMVVKTNLTISIGDLLHAGAFDEIAIKRRIFKTLVEYGYDAMAERFAISTEDIYSLEALIIIARCYVYIDTDMPKEGAA